MLIDKYCNDCESVGRQKLGIRQVFPVFLQ